MLLEIINVRFSVIYCNLFLAATTISEIPTDGALLALSGVNCTGDEERLIDCSNLGFGNHTCRSEQAVGLYCGSKGYVLYRYMYMYIRGGENIQVWLGHVTSSTLA